MASFNKNCLKGLKVNKKRVNELLNRSLMLVTPLTKVIGYDLASKVALNAYNKNISLKESCMELTNFCLLYTSPSPRDLSTSRMPSSA